MSAELSPLSTADAALVKADTRGELRRWLQAPLDAIAPRVSMLARDEIAGATALIARLDAVRTDGRAEALLDEIRAVIDQVHAPPRPRFELLARPPAPIELRLARARPTLDHALDGLAREEDRLAQAAVTGRSLQTRLAAADEALERAAHRIHALQGAAEAAAREIGGQDAARARALREPVVALLVERLGDALTQLAILRQARLSLALLLEGQEALARAIARTRTVMVSALRTAAAAAQGIGAGSRMTARAATLDGADAARAAEAAVVEIRTALA